MMVIVKGGNNMWLSGGTDEVSGLDYSLVKLTSEEFDKKMCTEFPKILQDRNKSMMVTCMHWGFEVGPGWQHLLYKLFSQLQAIYEQTGILVVADQIKSKYGTLRFYHHIKYRYLTDVYRAPVDSDRGIFLWLNGVFSIFDSIRNIFFRLVNKLFYNMSPQKIDMWVNIIDKLCDGAEADTGHICESCGKYYSHDPIYIGSWVHSDCIKCFKKNHPDQIEAFDEWYKETNQADKED